MNVTDVTDTFAWVALLFLIPLVGISLEVCWRFRHWWQWPRVRATRDDYLKHGVFLSFAGHGINAGFWAISAVAHIFDYPFQIFGGPVDPISKSPIIVLAIFAGLAHLIAIGRFAYILDFCTRRKK